jgi:hypothetical protein
VIYLAARSLFLAVPEVVDEEVVAVVSHRVMAVS